MTAALRRLRNDAELRESLVRSGLETIRARHTCGHRADELLAIVASLDPSPSARGRGPLGEAEWAGEGVRSPSNPHLSVAMGGSLPLPVGEGTGRPA
jgi:hypothetical protein